ncbi:MAG: hypothetical protein IBX70_08045 [Clostridia bacterium]|nr:hypothetical protein [Clostridia bacterium]
MNIKISDVGLEYLENKQHKTITLVINTSGGGCCPTFESEDIYFKAPQNPEEFNEFEVNSFKIYIDKKARVNTPALQFDVEKKLVFTKFTVRGLALKKQG